MLQSCEKTGVIPAPFIKGIYTADPSAHVFNGKIYIYPSHDKGQDAVSNDTGDQYDMEDYHIFSCDDVYSPVIDHGIALHVKDVPWASKQMWAPDAAYKNGKYYFYFPAKDKNEIFRIGVAVSDKPEGPFTPEKEPIKGSFSIDPAVFTDKDGSSYMYFGGLWGGQLERWQTGSYVPDAQGPAFNENALGPRVAKMKDSMTEFDGEVKEIVILDETGKPLKAHNTTKRFFEGVWMHRYKDTYYLSYSTGDTHFLVYATASNPYGPFTYRGKILEPVKGWTTHHSIVEFKGNWFLFHHDAALSGADNKRSVQVKELAYNKDGTIQTIKPYQTASK